MAKVTRKDNFATIKGILNGIGNSDFDEFLDKEIEKAARKRTSTKPTAKQIANEEIKEQIFAVLANAEDKLTIADIITALDKPYTPQKISGLLRQMEVKKEYDRKTPYFFL